MSLPRLWGPPLNGPVELLELEREDGAASAKPKGL